MQPPRTNGHAVAPTDSTTTTTMNGTTTLPRPLMKTVEAALNGDGATASTIVGDGRAVGLEKKSENLADGYGAGNMVGNTSGRGGKGGDDVPDAGLRSLDHYKRALPPWRYNLRRYLLPLIRWETPYLAYMQNLLRTPMLDTYFAITANLGTHTFFMISLPIMFWCGFPWFGKGLIHILASGVFATGFLKDFLSLPRPLSPPLHRISMSGSAALEYGFPSTHSANSVSVAVYSLLLLHQNSPSPTSLHPTTIFFLQFLAYFYAISIIFGRLYCGMHGFLDVIVGSIMGYVISFAEFHLGPPVDEYLTTQATWVVPVVFAVGVVGMVRIHPEPADDCPCFDDSVAFAGVLIGLEGGSWRFANSEVSYYVSPPSLEAAATAAEEVGGVKGPFATPAHLGFAKMSARVLVGVFIIFLFRETMKPTLLTSLPHIFRFISHHGIDIPRRFFTPASKYITVPLGVKTDNVIPNVKDIPDIVRSLGGGKGGIPGRGRSVSVGPQSAADVYETLAYREGRKLRKRRGGGGRDGSMGSVGSHEGGGLTVPSAEEGVTANGTGADIHLRGGDPETQQQLQHQSLEMYEQMMGEGRVMVNDHSHHHYNHDPTAEKPDQIDGSTNGNSDDEEPEIYISRENELGEREVFSRLQRPRVRYDVEVVTKLVVYTGIAWLSVDIIPILFEYIGLGIGQYQ